GALRIGDAGAGGLGRAGRWRFLVAFGGRLVAKFAGFGFSHFFAGFAGRADLQRRELFGFGRGVLVELGSAFVQAGFIVGVFVRGGAGFVESQPGNVFRHFLRGLFVAGFGKLVGERGDVFLGEAGNGGGILRFGARAGEGEGRLLGKRLVVGENFGVGL